MKPGEPIGNKKIGLFHALFARIGEEATEEVRDQIEEMTGSPSTTSLNEAQGWELLNGMFAQLGEKTPLPIVAAWCPVYSRFRAKLPGGNAEAIPSQRQVWHLFHLLREAGVEEPLGFFRKRFSLKGGVIRTAREAGWVAKALREMRDRNGNGNRKSQGRRAGG